TMLLERISSAGTTVTELDLRENVAPFLMALRGSLFQELVEKGYYRVSPEQARTMWLFLGLAGCAVLGFFSFLISPLHQATPQIVGGILGAVIVIAFAKLMPRRTSDGAKAYAKLKGFQEFIRRARGQELDW